MSRGGQIFNKSLGLSLRDVRRLSSGNGKIENQTASSLSGSLVSTSSFRFDAPGSGLKSTQQLKVDWSDFSSHTFFNSAEAKVNSAFDTIINKFPFDGTRGELDEYLDNLTGYDAYILGRFPRHIGFLHFSGTQMGETTSTWTDPNSGLGTYVEVEDFAGSLFPKLSKDNSGLPIIDPGTRSISFEFFINPATGSLEVGNQVLFQKLSGSNHGITIGLSGSRPTEDYTRLIMIASSGSAVISSSMDIHKGAWNHVCAVLNRTAGNGRIELYRDSALKSTSDYYNIKDFGFQTSAFMIGSGSSHMSSSAGSVFQPLQTFSGTLDELRIFHGLRSTTDQRGGSLGSIFPKKDDDSLRMYFKFNEASGSYTSNDVLLDSSGNSLHSRVSNYRIGSRQYKGVPLPLPLEDPKNNPILFPTLADTVSLNVELLASASSYDVNNPNLITKLVPSHYLQIQAQAEGFANEEADTSDPYSYYSGEPMPGGGRMGSPQLVSALLFTWAKFFDEIKMYLDAFSNLTFVDYDETKSIAPHLLPFLDDYYSLQLPTPYSGASFLQFLRGMDLKADSTLSTMSLMQVQNGIWRRILVNLRDMMKSKGTVHAIKAFLRASGLNPNKNFRIREFGGNMTAGIGQSRRGQTDVSSMINFSGSLSQSIAPTLDASGIGSTMPNMRLGFLSASRIEPGWPYPRGTMVDKDYEGFGYHGISDNRGDGMFTSGSWTFEGVYKFEKGIDHNVTQSLARLHTTGSANTFPLMQANLLAFPTAKTQFRSPRGTTYVQTGSIGLHLNTSHHSAQMPSLYFELGGVNIFDGNKWYISFGRERNDEIGSVVSSSFFIRAGRQNFGEIIEFKSASIFFEEDPGPLDEADKNILQLFDANTNVSGSFVAIGSQSIGNSSRYLNNYTNSGEQGRYTKFSGKVGRTRFWSRALTETECIEHTKNFKSVGAVDPAVKFNFVTQLTGSFNKLRLDATIDQPVTMSDATGDIGIFDFSQNNLHGSGSGFEVDKRIIVPERFDFSMLDPKFDEPSQDNKVRIRGWSQFENVELFGGDVSPVYEIAPNKQGNDDLRFAMEISSVQALNEDIINIFATLDAIDDAIGKPELQFTDHYPDLLNLREVYFNRLTEQINLRGFFEFFKWFDTSFSSFIEKLLPRKTRFLGVNYIVESHMLERAKIQYNFADHYLGENNRNGLKGTILLRQLIGQVKRF